MKTLPGTDVELFEQGDPEYGQVVIDGLPLPESLGRRRLPDGRTLWLEPMTFGRVKVGVENQHIKGSYDDVWEFENPWVGVLALAHWPFPDEGHEPVGWDRHPATRRYRPDADPAREYVKES